MTTSTRVEQDEQNGGLVIRWPAVAKWGLAIITAVMIGVLSALPFGYLAIHDEQIIAREERKAQLEATKKLSTAIDELKKAVMPADEARREHERLDERINEVDRWLGRYEPPRNDRRINR